MDLSFVENVERGNFKDPNPAYCLHYLSAAPNQLIFDSSTYEIKSDLVKCKLGYKLYCKDINYREDGGKHCIMQKFFEYEKSGPDVPDVKQYVYVLEIDGNRATDAAGTEYYGSYRYVNAFPSTLVTSNSGFISFQIRSYKYKMGNQDEIIPVPWDCRFEVDTLKDNGLMTRGKWSDPRLNLPGSSARRGTGKNNYGDIDINKCEISWNSNDVQLGPGLQRMPGATLPYLPTALIIHQEQGHVDPYDQYSATDGRALQGCVQVHVQYGGDS